MPFTAAISRLLQNAQPLRRLRPPHVIHCHILAHEDGGMMTVVEVAPSRSPYSHH
jgi:hypothetical protein